MGVIKESQLKLLKRRGGVKEEIVCRKGFLKESPPLPPLENFNRTLDPHEHLLKGIKTVV